MASEFVRQLTADLRYSARLADRGEITLAELQAATEEANARVKDAAQGQQAVGLEAALAEFNRVRAAAERRVQGKFAVIG